MIYLGVEFCSFGLESENIFLNMTYQVLMTMCTNRIVINLTSRTLYIQISSAFIVIVVFDISAGGDLMGSKVYWRERVTGT